MSGGSMRRDFLDGAMERFAAELVLTRGDEFFLIRSTIHIESLLDFLLQNHFVHRDRVDLRKSPRNAKLKLAEALGIIDNTTSKMIDALYRARNGLAHSSTSSIADLDDRLNSYLKPELQKAVEKQTDDQFSKLRILILFSFLQLWNLARLSEVDRQTLITIEKRFAKPIKSEIHKARRERALRLPEFLGGNSLR
jgi:hypothetical protein